jgi:hypothetical protein
MQFAGQRICILQQVDHNYPFKMLNLDFVLPVLRNESFVVFPELSFSIRASAGPLSPAFAGPAGSTY